MTRDIIISEPWNFESSDGKNILKIEILEKKGNDIVANVLSKYVGMTGKVLLTIRDKEGGLNIYHLEGENLEKKQFVMIGSFK